jgi:hypothetical protein
MKHIMLFLLANLAVSPFLNGQTSESAEHVRKAITMLIDQYSEAREKRDTVLLKTVLTGEWRNGIGTAVEGMLKSSATTPGTRKLTVDKIRILNPTTGIVDCRYDIQHTDSTMRRMWSTFIVVAEQKVWKISAIRNMLPAGQ